MAVLFLSKTPGLAEIYKPLLERELPGMEIRTWPADVGKLADVTYAVVGLPEPGVLQQCPNLKAILSTWAGVDKLLADPTLPRHLPLSRMVDPLLAVDMSHFAIHWVLHFHRNIHLHLAAQREGRWEQIRYPEASRRRVGIMGLGQLGSDAARKLAGLGFDVGGWDAIPKRIEGVTPFLGEDQFTPFLNWTEILVSLLPLTAKTRGILDARSFAALPKGAYIVSIARGGHIVDADLLAALDSGQIAGAALDSFNEEPLPQGHRFWTHPKVFVTPHVASLTTPRTAAREVAIDIRRLERGELPRHLVDIERGY
jgi:glyoxylate/hydroxypyruvate reductase A